MPLGVISQDGCLQRISLVWAHRFSFYGKVVTSHVWHSEYKCFVTFYRQLLLLFLISFISAFLSIILFVLLYLSMWEKFFTSISFWLTPPDKLHYVQSSVVPRSIPTHPTSPRRHTWLRHSANRAASDSRDALTLRWQRAEAGCERSRVVKSDILI